MKNAIIKLLSSEKIVSSLILGTSLIMFGSNFKHHRYEFEKCFVLDRDAGCLYFCDPVDGEKTRMVKFDVSNMEMTIEKIKKVQTSKQVKRENKITDDEFDVWIEGKGLQK